MAGGNTDVVLCERGIRTFESYTRNTLDISAIPVIHKLSHLPIVVDPSHGTGLRDKVAPMARAAVAAGADGLLIEVHPDPERARSDGAQSMFPDQFEGLDGRVAHHCAGHRPQHLPGAGGQPRRRVARLSRAMTDTHRRLPVVQPGPSASEPPVFDKVAIVGLGLIGGSLALAVRETWPGGMVIGVDEKPVLERAMLRHAIDVAADDPVVMAEADLVVLAAPVRTNLALLAALEEHVSGAAIVTDVGSTKRDIVEAARVLPARLTFIGGHPLGGAPRSGIDHARPDLFRDRPWLLTPADDRHVEALEKLRQFVTGFGAVPHVLAPDAHDRLLAVSQSRAATDCERADARGRRRHRRGRFGAERAGAGGPRRAWRRVRPTSGGTSARPTPTRSALPSMG